MSKPPCLHALMPSCLRPAVADDGEAFLVDLLRIREEVAPDLGRRRELDQASAKRLDGQPAVVLNGFQRLERRGEIDMAAPRRAAVVLRDMDVVNRLRMLGDGADRVLLLDVAME